MSSLWDRFQQYYLRHDALGFSIDICRVRFGGDFLEKMEPAAQNAFAAMKALEAGGIANPDEKRMVGHLQGFLRGTRAALFENGRDSITVSIPEVTPYTVGALIALYERAVGFYGSPVNINAYHQPGVEAGMKAAAGALKTLARARGVLSAQPRTAPQIAAIAGDDPEAVDHALTHLAANLLGVQATIGAGPSADTFAVS